MRFIFAYSTMITHDDSSHRFIGLSDSCLVEFLLPLATHIYLLILTHTDMTHRSMYKYWGSSTCIP
jgi:hypothetical protein